METAAKTQLAPIVDPKEFSLEESKALNISNSFAPKIAERDGYVGVYENLLTKEITEATTKEARELRLKLVKVRTGIDSIHKTEKAYYLAAGKYVDALKNKLQAPIIQMEEKLEEVEKFYENQEKQRIEAIRLERLALIQPYTQDVPLGLSQMEEETFEAILAGFKAKHEAKVEAERLAEIGRLEAEQKEREEQERIRLENEQLKKDAEEKERLLAIERAKQEAEKKSIEEKSRKEREAAEKKLAAERAESERILAEQKAKQEAELKAEREKQAKLEAELKSKQEAEKKAEQERKDAELKAQKEAEKLAKAPVKKQLSVWVNSFDIPKTEIDNETSKAIKEKFEAFKTWSLTQINIL